MNCDRYVHRLFVEHSSFYSFTAQCRRSRARVHAQPIGEASVEADSGTSHRSTARDIVGTRVRLRFQIQCRLSESTYVGRHRSSWISFHLYSGRVRRRSTTRVQQLC